MEKRKSKILTHFNEIIEEKVTLEHNLQKLMNQAFSCADFVKNSTEDMKQKDVSLILKHELEILKKLTEINYELENVVENNPLNQLHISEKYYEIDETKVPESIANLVCIKTENKSVLDPSNLVCEQETVALSSTDNIFTGGACSSNCISDSSLRNYNDNTQINVDTDIQSLIRESLKKFGEKLGVSQQSLLDMRDYYDKPSSSIKEPSCSQIVFDSIANETAINTSLPITPLIFNTLETSVNKNNFEIPEKDTNTTVTCEPILIDNTIEASHVTEQAYGSSLYHAEDSSVSTETEILNAFGIDQGSSSDDFVVKEPVHCLSASAKINNDLLIFSDGSESPEDSANNSNNSATGTGTGSSLENLENCSKEPTNDEVTMEGVSEHPDDPSKLPIIYTALEKLNNLRFNNTEAYSSNFQPLKMPDIKLKPIEKQPSVIKNDLESNNEGNSKLRKKKNRKNKRDNDKDRNFYELRSKPAPAVGADCAFSHVESPNEFYIHIVDEESVLVDTLTEQINEYFEGTTSKYGTKEEALNSIGRYCFVYIADYTGWFRAEVLEWYLDRKFDEVLVQLVDFGNKRSISYKSLRRMTKEMAEIPILASRCHLPLMYPPLSTRANRLTEWPTSSIDALLELSGLFNAEGSEPKMFRIVYAQNEGDSVAIDLYSGDDCGNTVGEILLTLGLATQIVDDFEEDDADLEMFLDDVDTLENADNINEAITGYDPHDEARICRFTNKEGVCFKGKGCKLEHVPFAQGNLDNIEHIDQTRS